MNLNKNWIHLDLSFSLVIWPNVALVG